MYGRKYPELIGMKTGVTSSKSFRAEQSTRGFDGGSVKCCSSINSDAASYCPSFCRYS